MPPRYAYWTILVDNQPTAFRSGSQEELMPTFKQLQQKHASAKMMWWQNGKLWPSRIDAQEAMRARGEMGRASDFKQRERRPGEGKPEWRPKARFAAEGREPRRSAKREGGYSDRAPRASERREERNPAGKLDWKPKGEHGEAPREARTKKPEWKPKGSFTPERQKFPAEGRESRRSAKREGGPEWKPKGSFKPERSARPDWKPQSRDDRPRRLEWTPKSQASTFAKASADKPSSKSPEKRKWVPKAEYKKSLGIEAKKDKNWRPGGEHKDPRQKYKDAKKAKWGRFKQTVRTRWESKQGKKEK